MEMAKGIQTSLNIAGKLEVGRQALFFRYKAVSVISSLDVMQDK